MLDRAPPDTKDQLGEATRPVAFRGAGFTPGGSRYLAWAVAERLLPMGFDGPALSRAQMLLLPAPAAADARPALPVGPACRICPRPACPARHEPSILGPA